MVVDFFRSANIRLSQECGVPPIGATDWHWYRQYPDGEKIFHSLFDPSAQANFWRSLRPVLGAVRGVHFLWRRHPLMFVTHRHEELAGVTQAWLDRHGLGDIPVHYCRGNTGKRPKTELPMDLQVDDKPSTVEEFLDMGRGALLFRQPWNHEAWKRLPGVRSWTELLLRVEWGGGRVLQGAAS